MSVKFEKYVQSWFFFLNYTPSKEHWPPTSNQWAFLVTLELKILHSTSPSCTHFLAFIPPEYYKELG